MSTKKNESVIKVWISGGEAIDEEYNINVISNAVPSEEKKSEQDPRNYYPELGLVIQEITPEPVKHTDLPQKKKRNYSILQ